MNFNSWQRWASSVNSALPINYIYVIRSYCRIKKIWIW